MGSNDRTQFLQLFKEEKIHKISHVMDKLGISDSNQIKEKLTQWKLQDYFDMKNDILARNSNIFPWEKIKDLLKKAGKFALGKGIPVAISMATGGMGLGLTLAPIVGSLIEKLQKQKIDVPDDFESDIQEIVGGRTDSAIESLTNKLNSKNQMKFSMNGMLSPQNLNNSLKLILNEELQPVLAEAQASLQIIQHENLDIAFILEEWINNQRELAISQENNFERINQSLNGIEDFFLKHQEEFQAQFGKTNTILNQLDHKIEFLFDSLCSSAWESLSYPELKQFMEIYFQRINLAGRSSQPFNSELFIPNQNLDFSFREFIHNNNSSSEVYLLLANVGIGKTWNAVHIAQITMAGDRMIPIFVPLHMGFEELLRPLFNINGPNLLPKLGDSCRDVFSRFGIKILLVFDGLDEYPNENRKPFFNFIEQILRQYTDSIRILITGRITDWNQNYSTQQFYQKLDPHIFASSAMEQKRQQYSIQTQISFILEEFSDEQLYIAIDRYKLERSRFSVELLQLCHRPYILRLVYDTNKYPNPKIPEEFMELFYNPENLQNTILYRMGIMGSIQDFFFRVIDFFQTAENIKAFRDLDRLIQSNIHAWDTILCSGIIIESIQGFEKYYRFDPVFHPIIQYYLSIQQEKDYSEIVRKITPLLQVGKEMELNAEIAKYALKKEDYLAIIKDFAITPNFYNISHFERLYQLFPEIYIEFTQDRENFGFLKKILWQTSIECWNSQYPEQHSRLYWLRMEHKWPWSRQDLVELIKFIFHIDAHNCENFITYLSSEIVFDDPGHDWLIKLNKLFTQNLPIEVLRLHANRGSSTQRMAFINEVMSQVPPPSIDRIYFYGQLFPFEMNLFFQNIGSEDLIVAIIAMDNGDSLKSINDEYREKWHDIRQKKWTGKKKDLIEYFGKLFGLQINTATKLANKILIPQMKFVSNQFDVETRSEFERDFYVFKKNLDENTRHVVNQISNQMKEIPNNLKDLKKKSSEFFKNLGKKLNS